MTKHKIAGLDSVYMRLWLSFLSAGYVHFLSNSCFRKIDMWHNMCLNTKIIRW